MFVLIALFVIFNYRIIRERDGNEEKIEELRSEKYFLEEKKIDLETDLDKIADKEYIERVLREDFLMKKPGEKKVVILTEDEVGEEVLESEGEESFFNKIKRFIPFIN